MKPDYTDKNFLMFLDRLGYKLADYPKDEHEAFWRGYLAHTFYTGIDRRYIENELRITRETRKEIA